MTQYEEFGNLAQVLGYPRFTPLQDKAFSNPDINNKGQNVFIIGETSSGKTLIPLLLYLKQYYTAKADNRPVPKMIYAVPYRALANQKKKDFDSLLGKLGYGGTGVVESTGEKTDHDADIMEGAVDIAVIITEKIYRFICQDSAVLDHYQFFVIDEVGLLSSMDRGCKIDFLFALVHRHQYLRSEKDFRMISLGTPFYNWDAYIENYGFLKVYSEGRPVPLRILPIHYSRNSNLYAFCPDDKEAFESTFFIRQNGKFSCPVTQTECENALAQACGEAVYCACTGQPCDMNISYVPPEIDLPSAICARLCKYHLGLGHQILIFVNDRERVRAMAAGLFLLLRDTLKPNGGLLTVEECKSKYTEEIGIDAEDLWGIFDDIHYLALNAGVAFHSAALPEQVRSWTEDKFLASRKGLKIVCSTETLAFGVNSNVEAVIVADLNKNDGDTTRLLTVNEFQNYAGRAGRLHPNAKPKDNYGYVYPLIRLNGKDDPNTLARLKWVKEQINLPKNSEILYSHFYGPDEEGQGSTLPFFMLTLLSPNDEMTMEDILDSVDTLPHPASISREKVIELCEEALQSLLNNKLIYRRKNSNPFDHREFYKITNKGAHLRGYILGFNDYHLLERGVKKAVVFDNGIPRVDVILLLDYLLSTAYLKKDMENFFRRRKYTEEDVKRILAATADELKYDLENVYECSSRDVNHFICLAALLDWGRSEQVRRIFTKFKLPYPLIQNLSQQVCYLIEICRAILLDEWEELEEQSLKELIDSFSRLWLSLFNGIDGDIYRKIIDYLSEKNPQLAEKWKHVNVENKRILRRAVTYYRFFEHVSEMGADGKPPITEDTVRLCRQYRTSIQGISFTLNDFFAETFGDAYRVD